MTNNYERAYEEITVQENRLRDMARAIAEDLLGTNLTAYGTNLAVSSVSMRISADGSVLATASLKVSKYVSSRAAARNLEDSMK